MNYSEKLRDPRWQKKRLRILERDDFACQACFDTTSTLHIHHKFYSADKEPWDYDDNALVTLCEGCHKTEGEICRQEEKALIDTLKLGGALAIELNALMDAFGRIREQPLVNAEWSILVEHIRSLLMDRETLSGLWRSTSDQYWAKAIKAADKENGPE